MTRRTIVVAVGAALGLALLWFVFLWGPQGGRLHDATERANVVEQQNDELELRLARLRDSESRSAALLADVEKLRRAVPDQPELAEFILDANQAASDTDVDFLSVSPGVPTVADAGLPPVIPLAVTVSGGYFSVLDYLDRLTELPRVVIIDAIAVTPSGSTDGTTTGDLSVDLTARMFSTAAPQLPGASAAVDAAATTTTAPAPAPETTTTSTAAGAQP